MARRIVVAGGSSGMGKATAARFVENGDEVWVTGRNQEKLKALAEELDVVTLRCDHSDPDDVASLAQALPETLDVLVNAAGANTQGFAPMTDDVDLHELAGAWHRGLDANLMTAVLTTAALAPRIVPGGSVISIGSEATESAATSYGAAKAALAAWSAGMSAVIGSRGVTVNTVTPNYTEGTDFYPSALPDAMRDALIASTHDKRAGTPEDVAGAVFFLAGSEARHVTAQNLHVSGGIYITR